MIRINGNKPNPVCRNTKYFFRRIQLLLVLCLLYSIMNACLASPSFKISKVKFWMRRFWNLVRLLGALLWLCAIFIFKEYGRQLFKKNCKQLRDNCTIDLPKWINSKSTQKTLINAFLLFEFFYGTSVWLQLYTCRVAQKVSDQHLDMTINHT